MLPDFFDRSQLVKPQGIAMEDDTASLKLWKTQTINNDNELSVTLERIPQMQDQLALLRRVYAAPLAGDYFTPR